MGTPSESAVINTGPVIALVAACGSLHLFGKLFVRPVLPREVWAELLAGGSESPEVRAGRSEAGMEICSEPTPIQEPLLSSLDSGEAAVIQTALHRGISRVILDERLGRGIATRLGLEVMGSLGVLVRAKRAGFLDSVSPCLERMTQAGIRISSELGRLALQQAGES